MVSIEALCHTLLTTVQQINTACFKTILLAKSPQSFRNLTEIIHALLKFELAFVK